MGQKFPSLAHGNWTELPHVLNVLFLAKSQFWEKSGTSHREIAVSSTTQYYNDVTTPYYPISVLGFYTKIPGYFLRHLEVSGILRKFWDI